MKFLEDEKMRDRTGAGVILIVVGIVLIDILGNLFINSVGVYTYIFLPLPMLGILAVFLDRKRHNTYHRKLVGLALILIIGYFLFFLTLGLLNKIYFIQKGDFRFGLNVIYCSEGLQVLAFFSSILAVAGLNRDRLDRFAALGMIIALVLVITTIFLIQAPAEDMMDGLNEIARDGDTHDSQRRSMLENEIEDYKKSLLLPRLPLVFAGITTLIAVLILSREQLKQIRKSIKERIRGNLRVGG